jgi:hypothetical protein
MKTLIRTYLFTERFDKSLTEADRKEAEKLCQEALALAHRILGPHHIETLGTKYDLACLLSYWGRTEEATQLLRETLDECHRVAGTGHFSFYVMRKLADTLETLGQTEEAAKLREAIPDEIKNVDPSKRAAGLIHDKTAE